MMTMAALALGLMTASFAAGDDLPDGMKPTDAGIVIDSAVWSTRVQNGIVVAERKGSKKDKETLGLACSCGATSSCSATITSAGTATCTGATCCTFSTIRGDALDKALETH